MTCTLSSIGAIGARIRVGPSTLFGTGVVTCHVSHLASGWCGGRSTLLVVGDLFKPRPGDVRMDDFDCDNLGLMRAPAGIVDWYFPPDKMHPLGASHVESSRTLSRFGLALGIRM